MHREEVDRELKEIQKEMWEELSREEPDYNRIQDLRRRYEDIMYGIQEVLRSRLLKLDQERLVSGLASLLASVFGTRSLDVVDLYSEGLTDEEIIDKLSEVFKEMKDELLGESK